MRFEEVLPRYANVSPAKSQAEARVLLPRIVEEHGFNWYKLNESILEGDKNRIILGVASYVLYELKFLDILSEHYHQSDQENQKLPVFYIYDICRIKSPEEFDSIVPTIGKVCQSPVLGVWANGLLEYKGWGCDAMRYLTKKFGISTCQLKACLALPEITKQRRE